MHILGCENTALRLFDDSPLPPASPPTLVGGSDTFSSQRTRMHFVLLRGMHVLTSRARAVSSRVQPCALVPREPLWVHVVIEHL